MNQLRNRLVLIFLAATLIPLGVTLWITTSLLDRSLSYASTRELDELSVAFNRILADDIAHYNRANAVSTIVMNIVGVVGPLLAGAFIAVVSASIPLRTVS